MYLTAPQISALAQLLLQKGNWKGGQLVPSWWIEEMGKPRVEIPDTLCLSHKSRKRNLCGRGSIWSVSDLFP